MDNKAIYNIAYLLSLFYKKDGVVMKKTTSSKIKKKDSKKKTNIVLVTLFPKTHRIFEENLGLEYLKAVLTKEKYNVIIIDGWLNELTVDAVYGKIMKVKDPLFVGISSYMANDFPTINLITKLKNINPKVTIVCGGYGPTFYPVEYLNNGADIVLRGEGEQVIVDLSNSLKTNSKPIDVKGICYKNNNGLIIFNDNATLIKNLDSIPYPSRDFLKYVLEQKSTVNLLTSRGTTDDSVVSDFFKHSKGKTWRGRSIKNIIDEIEELYNQGINHIKVIDDSFIDGNRNQKWCKLFANEIIKRKIKVRLCGKIKAEKVTDDILEHLKRAGFFLFVCDIQNIINDNETTKTVLELFKKHKYIVKLEYESYSGSSTLEEIYNFLKKTDFVISPSNFSKAFLREDIKEHKIYEALKTWWEKYNEIYDMAVNPILSPKAINKEQIEEFYYYAMKIKNKGLGIFKLLLDTITKDENADLLPVINKEIKNNEEYYNLIKEELQKLYIKNDIVYKNSSTPFI